MRARRSKRSFVAERKRLKITGKRERAPTWSKSYLIRSFGNLRGSPEIRVVRGAACYFFRVVGLKAARAESASQDHKRSRDRYRCKRESDQQRAPNCSAKIPASYRLAPVLSSRALLR